MDVGVDARSMASNEIKIMSSDELQAVSGGSVREDTGQAAHSAGDNELCPHCNQIHQTKMAVSTSPQDSICGPSVWTVGNTDLFNVAMTIIVRYQIVNLFDCHTTSVVNNSRYR